MLLKPVIINTCAAVHVQELKDKLKSHLSVSQNEYICVCVCFFLNILSAFSIIEKKKKKGLGEISEIVCWVLGCVMSLSD